MPCFNIQATLLQLFSPLLPFRLTSISFSVSLSDFSRLRKEEYKTARQNSA